MICYDMICYDMTNTSRIVTERNVMKGEKYF